MNSNPDAINDALSLLYGLMLIGGLGIFVAVIALTVIGHRRKTKQLEQAGRL